MAVACDMPPIKRVKRRDRERRRKEDIGVWVGVIGIEEKVRVAIGEVVPFLFQYYHLYITH